MSEAAESAASGVATEAQDERRQAPPPQHGLSDRAKAERRLGWMLCAPAAS